MATSDSERKAAVRRAVRTRRSALSESAMVAATEALTSRLIGLAEAIGARTIASYSPRPDEPNVSPFTAAAVSRGIAVLLPVSNPDRSLSWVSAGDGGLPSATQPGLHGIEEPVGERLPPTAIRGADLVLVPACAVDLAGTRLGWGLGYYDRALADLDPATPVYAVVFDEDVFPELPSEPHDAKVTGVVTPGALRVTGVDPQSQLP